MSINFFNEGIKLKLADKRILKKWVSYIIEEEKGKLGEINFIFSSDEYVKEINEKYLHHNYYTDIITFNYNENGTLNGDIFISVDTVRDNAIKYHVSFENEIKRVIIHGVLHLLGYDDVNKNLKSQIRKKENYAIDIFYFKFLIK